MQLGSSWHARLGVEGASSFGTVADRAGIRLLLEKVNDELKQLKLIWLDVGYRGQAVQWLAERLHCLVEVVKKPVGGGVIR